MRRNQHLPLLHLPPKSQPRLLHQSLLQSQPPRDPVEFPSLVVAFLRQAQVSSFRGNLLVQEPLLLHNDVLPPLHRMSNQRHPLRPSLVLDEGLLAAL